MRIPIFIIFALILSCKPIPLDKIDGKIVKIKDGDSVVLLDNSNQQHEIRLAHIDAPERGQPFGKQSKEFLSNLIANELVTLLITDDPDRYGREIGEIVLPDGSIANEEMVKAGFAWHYDKYSNAWTYRKLERQAKNELLGLWKDGNAMAPWEWRDSKKQ